MCACWPSGAAYISRISCSVLIAVAQRAETSRINLSMLNASPQQGAYSYMYFYLAFREEPKIQTHLPKENTVAT